MPTILRGFPPAGSSSPRILVLGSFPSVRSLEKREYYGNARNHFWEILALALGHPLPAEYEGRMAALAAAGLALWDMIGSCEREGSLDQDIRRIVPNPILGFIAATPSLRRIALNGGLAAEAFRRHLAPELKRRVFSMGTGFEWRPEALSGRALSVARLPSSSPVPTREFRSAADKAGLWKDFIMLHGY